MQFFKFSMPSFTMYDFHNSTLCIHKSSALLFNLLEHIIIHQSLPLQSALADPPPHSKVPSFSSLSQQDQS